ncbi:MAG: CRISPR-associated endonuclease Cas2 [Clostridiales bacterium]|nr:CRISPR-associated endonuclease Cas2 [Clostridiales bacterium]
MYIILVYDIKTDDKGIKILSKPFKTCKKYLNHIQNSVFEGDLSEGQLLKLKLKLNQIIRQTEDSVIVFSGRNKKWLDKDFWGKTEDNTDSFL